MNKIRLLLLLLTVSLLSACQFNNTSTTSSQQSTKNEIVEDIKHYQEFISKIGKKEEAYMASYKKYEELYFSHNEKAAYDIIIKETIPIYDSVKHEFVDYIPKTKEVKQIHNMYISGSYKQLAALYLIKGSIEKSDSKLMADSILIMGEAHKDLSKFGIDYVDFVKEYYKK